MATSIQRTAAAILADLCRACRLGEAKLLAARAAISTSTARRILAGDCPAFDTFNTLVKAMGGQVSLGLAGMVLMTPPSQARALAAATSMRGVLRETLSRAGVAAVQQIAAAAGMKAEQVKFAMNASRDGHLLPVHRVLTALNTVLAVDIADVAVVLAPAALQVRAGKVKKKRQKKDKTENVHENIRVLALARQGLSLQKIADKFCRRDKATVTPQAVANCLRRHGNSSLRVLRREITAKEAEVRLRPDPRNRVKGSHP
jgi:hypothetical protein